MEDRIVEIKEDYLHRCQSSSAMTVGKFRIKECEIHRNIIKEKPRSITYRQRKYRKDIVERHIATYGYICSGWKRPPHFATDLTADHPLPTSKGGNEYQELVVYCRSCNSSKQSTIEMY